MANIYLPWGMGFNPLHSHHLALYTHIYGLAPPAPLEEWALNPLHRYTIYIYIYLYNFMGYVYLLRQRE
jgi:hypothetical protein